MFSITGLASLTIRSWPPIFQGFSFRASSMPNQVKTVLTMFSLCRRRNSLAWKSGATFTQKTMISWVGWSDGELKKTFSLPHLLQKYLQNWPYPTHLHTIKDLFFCTASTKKTANRANTFGRLIEKFSLVSQKRETLISTKTSRVFLSGRDMTMIVFLCQYHLLTFNFCHFF